MSVLDQLAEAFESVAWEDSHGQTVARVPVEDWGSFAEAAKEAGFEVCSDVTAVDWMRKRPERYEVVASLVSMEHKTRLRMVTSLGREDPTVASLTPIWPGAGYAEREGLRHVRYQVRRSSRPHPDPHARRLGGLSLAQGLRGGHGARPVKASHQVD